MLNPFFKARTRDKNRTSGGFTLIEMLVVVTIIVLLVSLVLPSVVNISNLGYRSSCFHNMYKIGQLNQEYSIANNGYVVPAGAINGPLPNPNTSFDELLREINTGNTARTHADANLYQCPAGPAGWTGIGGASGCPLHPLDPPVGNTDGGSYALNIHQNVSRWDGASWVWDMSVAANNIVGLKTSQWGDASGTIFLFETWRNGGWQDPSCAIDVTWVGGPMMAAFNGGNTHGVASADSQQAITIWQEKHVGKANLLFCDGHGDSKLIGDTLSIGETILTPGISYAPNPTPTMGSCYTVRGMWTHAGGD